MYFEYGFLFLRYVLSIDCLLAFQNILRSANNAYYICSKKLQLIFGVSTPCLKKLSKFVFVRTFSQISTYFDDFWQRDGKEAKIMRGALIFHLT